jgi:hypothetical protein
MALRSPEDPTARSAASVTWLVNYELNDRSSSKQQCIASRPTSQNFRKVDVVILFYTRDTPARMHYCSARDL